MNSEEKQRICERLQRVRIPEKFRHYRVALVDLPKHPDYDLIYDMPAKTIWINTAARSDANIIAVEPER